MAKFFATAWGDRGPVHRTSNHSMTTACQSYDGSIITELSYDKETGKLMVDISTSEDKTIYGKRLWYGSFEDFVKQLQK